MKNNKKKKIMTDLAAGHISKKEAEELMEEEKTPQIKPDKESKGKTPGITILSAEPVTEESLKKAFKEKPKNTHKRKKAIKSKEVK